MDSVRRRNRLFPRYSRSVTVPIPSISRQMTRPPSSITPTETRSRKDNVYTYEFFDNKHPSDLLEALGGFYISGAFTDVTLQCAESGHEFRCHKAMLSAHSAYFHVMFTADMKERSTDLIKLIGVDGSILGALVNFVYTARVRIDEGNVQSLLEAADLLQFSSVKQACEEFLIRLLDVDNCLGMHSFAQLHLCPVLEKEASRMLLTDFPRVIEQEEFLELDCERMKCVLSVQNINGQRVEVLITGVSKWIYHDLDNRVSYCADLMRSFQLDLDLPYLKATLDQYRSTVRKLKSLVIQAVMPGPKEVITRHKVTSSMFIIGGYYWHPLCEVHIWNLRTNTWMPGKDMPDHSRESYSVSLLGPKIYVTGGYRTNTVEALDVVSIYNCDCDEWTKGRPMITARYYHCSVTLHGCIYVIGGYRAGAPVREVEHFDPLKKKWFPVAQMIQGVGNATACAMLDKIYVTGGHYGYRGTCTYEKIQLYSPDIDEWTIVTICPHPEYGLCSVSLNNKLYLVGGQTTVADSYDPEKNEWRTLSVMKEMRMECAAMVVSGCIYVTGGYSYSKGTYLQSVEKYDPLLDSWEIVGALPSPARSHGCVCVYSA